MCRRYGFALGEFREIKVRFTIGGDLPLFKPSHNIAPERGDILAVVRSETGKEGRATRQLETIHLESALAASRISPCLPIHSARFQQNKGHHDQEAFSVPIADVLSDQPSDQMALPRQHSRL